MKTEQVPLVENSDAFQNPAEDMKSKIDKAASLYVRKKMKEKGKDITSILDNDAQPVFRAYMDIMKAVNELIEADVGEYKLELGLDGGRCAYVMKWINSILKGPSHEREKVSCLCTSLCCFILSFTICITFVGVAMIYNHNGFDQAVFFGWDQPDLADKWAKHIYCGLMLGLIFGFLDNFGLFYGMDALDPMFYYCGSMVAAGLEGIGFNKSNMSDEKKKPHDMHLVTADMMSGLGNTFR